MEACFNYAESRDLSTLWNLQISDGRCLLIFWQIFHLLQVKKKIS